MRVANSDHVEVALGSEELSHHVLKLRPLCPPGIDLSVVTALRHVGKKIPEQVNSNILRPREPARHFRQAHCAQEAIEVWARVRLRWSDLLRRRSNCVHRRATLRMRRLKRR
uniref:Uncharacterized protein n=1 Tax=Peronospora matthiolae TaxID=2874970 RepID=A0AAV1TLR8_9STRA